MLFRFLTAAHSEQARDATRCNGPVWLMVLLLATPLTAISSPSVRVLSSLSEESAPVWPQEEEHGSAHSERLEKVVSRDTAGRQLPVAPRSLSHGAARISSACLIYAEREAHNGCGASLRC